MSYDRILCGFRSWEQLPFKLYGEPHKKCTVAENILHPQKINRNSLLSILLGAFWSVFCVVSKDFRG